MGFAQEMKDFTAGFKAGTDIVGQGEDRKLKREELAWRKEKALSDEDYRNRALADAGAARGGFTSAKEQEEYERAIKSGGGGRPRYERAKERYDFLTKELGYCPWRRPAFSAMSTRNRSSLRHSERQDGRRKHQLWRVPAPRDRYTALKKVAAKKAGTWKDWRTPTDFADWETEEHPQGRGRGAGDGETPQEAADGFALHFERPGR